ncbi:MAG: hypothetical protein MK183_12790, partial [Verrucomicrobiales bacterium]|nr:hypothetical protein [Verrucomicrobiales bacterium]
MKDFLILTISCLVFLGTAHFGAAEDDPILVDPSYRNIITKDGNSYTGCNSFAAFSGNTGHHKNPTPKTIVGGKPYFLTRSSFGMAVAPSVPTAYMGQPIIPGIADAADVDLSREPDLVGTGMMWIDHGGDPLAGPGSLIAVAPGIVEITWKDSAGNPLEAETLSVIPAVMPADQFNTFDQGRDPDETVQFTTERPLRVYHTHDQSGTNFLSSSLIDKVPVVDFSGTGVQSIIPHYNTQILASDDKGTPETGDDEEYFKIISQQIHARDRTGLIVLEYRDIAGAFLGVETIEVVANIPDDELSVDIGDRILPAFPAIAPNERMSSYLPKPYVSKGINTTSPNLSMVYQHDAELSPWDGELYAVYMTDSIDDEDVNDSIEVYWMERGIANVKFPYQLLRYTSDWPDSSKRQLYVRGPAGNNGPAVSFHAELDAEVMEYKSVNHGADITANAFSTTGPGLALIKLTTPVNGRDAVTFQVVQSVNHDDGSFFELALIPWDIGEQVTPAGLPEEYRLATWEGFPGDFGDLRGSRSHLYVPADSPHDWDRYDPATGQQVIPVNTGSLELWWYQLNTVSYPDPDSPAELAFTATMQWPAVVQRYAAGWPADTSGEHETRNDKIIVAAQTGTGQFDPAAHQDMQIYVQNDAALPGFNPNDEHALILNPGTGPVFALRDDLGSPGTSLPHVLVKYRYAADNDLWRYEVYPVLAEGEGYTFNYPRKAGNTLLEPILPIPLFGVAANQIAENGPAPGAQKIFADRNGDHWAYAGGDNAVGSYVEDPPGSGTFVPEEGFVLGTETVTMHWWYSSQPDFYFPDGYPGQLNNAITGPVPLLDRRGDTAESTPTHVRYTVYWPDQVPPGLTDEAGTQINWSEVAQLRVGETLINPKYGLPDIDGQLSVSIAYQQATALDPEKSSVKLIDPIRGREIDLATLPANVQAESVGGEYRFTALPPHLRQRLYHKGGKLGFKGLSIVPAAGNQWLLPNIITARDKAELEFLLPELKQKITDLYDLEDAPASQALEIVDDSIDVDGKALTAGFATGTGYVTLVFSNSEDAGANPVALEVINVSAPLYNGTLRPILSENPFDEKATMRFDGDLAGKSDEYAFEWRWSDDGVGDPAGWSNHFDVEGGVAGAVDVSIGGPGIRTLSNNFFSCRYRPLNPDTLALVADPDDNPLGWSDWTNPGLIEGWMSRVLDKINHINQRFDDLSDPAKSINTTLDMISLAGPRFEGSVPLDPTAAETRGIIELYETILRRGLSFTIDVGIDLASYPSVAEQLQLVAGRLADLYVLLGNEAFADATDPTIELEGLADFSQPASLHSFMNLTGASSLLEEELSLLRGRDDSDAFPGVQTAPYYNRLLWNFTGAEGETAYVSNYGIRDHVTVDPTLGGVTDPDNGDGVISEEDAKVDYPQGHGDAWGHYTTALGNYYRLISNSLFLWKPVPGVINVGGIPTSVDFLDERKFARAAGVRAKTGAEIVNLTHRAAYTGDPSAQWQGYKDSDPDRAWGLAGWGSRTGQGAYIDWVVGNSLLPAEDTENTGIKKIDRTTVLELRDVAAALPRIQAEVDKADGGLNPLGIVTNVLPIDISPARVDAGESHFEQIYGRAVQSLNNALSVFKVAEGASHAIRQQSDQLEKYESVVADQEFDHRTRLIEIYGTPYAEDIGPTGSYRAGYDGWDYKNHDMIRAAEVTGVDITDSSLEFIDVSGLEESSFNPATLEVEREPTGYSYYLSQNGFGKVAPSAWSKRGSSGELQMIRSEMLQMKLSIERSLGEYDNLLAQIESEVDLLEAQQDLNAAEIGILRDGIDDSLDLNSLIRDARERQLEWRFAAQLATITANAVAEALPQNLIIGLSG